MPAERMRIEDRTLPVWRLKERIIDKIKLNHVTLICGFTGSGKSSQVPQMLLEEGLAPVLCTQPRRLAVVAVAKRVAKERGCVLGQEVSYHIGQLNISSSKSKIVFETAGILLEELRTDGVAALARYKVVVLDEVHERSIESDLVLTCAKQLMLRVESCQALVVCKSTPPAAAFAILLGMQAWPVVEGLQLEVTGRTTKCIAKEIQSDVLVVGDYKVISTSQDDLSVIAKGMELELRQLEEAVGSIHKEMLYLRDSKMVQHSHLQTFLAV